VIIKLEDAPFYQRNFTNVEQYTSAEFSGKPEVYKHVFLGNGAHAGKLCTKTEVYSLHPYKVSTNANQFHALYASSQIVQNWLNWYEELEVGLKAADCLLDEGECKEAMTAYLWVVKGFDSAARSDDDGYAHAQEQLKLIAKLLRVGLSRL
jgi:hypothetical protein